MSYISGDIEDKINELYKLIGTKVLYAEDITIAPSRWTRGGDSEFPFTAAVTVPGIDKTYFSMVEFRDSDVAKFDFAPYSRSSNDTVNIYAKSQPTSAIELPIVMCYKGTAVAGS